jgi:hypothetical protein
MANPTTNYGFVLPTSSDLVTDLPADFDVALQGVDTRLKALQPGTTLGDLSYSSATANTNTRLGIGSTGQILTVAGGVPSWATATGGITFSAYSPSYTNITIGNGTVVARYAESDKFVFVYWAFTLGSTSSIGSFNSTSLPVTAKSVDFVGSGYALDAATNELNGTIILNSTTTMRMLVPIQNSYGIGPTSATVPWTWGTSDKMIYTLTYEKA